MKCVVVVVVVVEHLAVAVRWTRRLARADTLQRGEEKDWIDEKKSTWREREKEKEKWAWALHLQQWLQWID